MSEGAKIALIVGGILGALVLAAVALFMLLPLILGAIFFSSFDDVMDEYSPMAIQEGRSFEWNDSDYDSGWSVSSEAGGHLRPTDITFASDNGAVESSPETYSIAFVREGLIVTQASCETAGSIDPGGDNGLECEATDDVVGEYDEIVIGYPEDLTDGEPWDLFPDLGD